MAARVGSETVRAPGEVWVPGGKGQGLWAWAPPHMLMPCSAGSLVISAYAVCSDITATVTPDLKRPGGRGMVSSPSFMHCVFTAQSFVWGLLNECSGRLSTGAVVPSGADDWGVLPHPGSLSDPAWQNGFS